MRHVPAIIALFIDDSKPFRDLVEAIFENNPLITPIFAPTFLDGLQMIAAGGADVVVLDLVMPDTGIPGDAIKTTAVSMVKTVVSALRGNRIPLIVCSSLGDSGVAMAVIEAGAAGYLDKHQMFEMPERIVHTARMREALGRVDAALGRTDGQYGLDSTP